MHNRSLHNGFTLIELSIVLVIIGLIVGGVLVGRDLIRSAELRTIITDIQRFQTATHTFQEKYAALPGDITNATTYWGAAGGSSSDNYTASCYLSQGTGTQTCNGSGNALIDPWGETFRYWQHLSNAGLVQGKYSGVAGAAEADEAIVGTNVPALKFGEAGVTILDFGMMDASRGNFVGYFPGYYGNMYFIGKKVLTQFTYGNFARPSDVYQIDLKMDDGLPGTGKILNNKNGGCATTTDPATALYRITSNEILCQLFAVNQF